MTTNACDRCGRAGVLRGEPRSASTPIIESVVLEDGPAVLCLLCKKQLKAVGEKVEVVPETLYAVVQTSDGAIAVLAVARTEAAAERFIMMTCKEELNVSPDDVDKALALLAAEEIYLHIMSARMVEDQEDL
jgi:hypothetical protein